MFELFEQVCVNNLVQTFSNNPDFKIAFFDY